MKKARLTIPRLVQKRVYQESSSSCAFCREVDVESLQIHHIDCDPSNSDEQNLIVVCANCHTKITAGTISQADVSTKKRELFWTAKVNPPASVQVSIVGSTFRGDIAQTITKISTKGSPRIQHPVGSIGADLPRKGYIDYLIARYYEFRSADSSYGRRVKFSYAVIHTNIQREFGCKTFFIPVDRFDSLVSYLQRAIDRTIQAKRNRSAGKSAYHTFEEHLRR